MTIHPIKGAYADQLDRDRERLAAERDSRANRAFARKHLTLMNPDRLDALQREWREAEAAITPVRLRITPEIKAQADEEWDQLSPCGPARHPPETLACCGGAEAGGSGQPELIPATSDESRSGGRAHAGPSHLIDQPSEDRYV